jgi:hypothetical protein
MVSPDKFVRGAMPKEKLRTNEELVDELLTKLLIQMDIGFRPDRMLLQVLHQSEEMRDLRAQVLARMNSNRSLVIDRPAVEDELLEE